jgi:hypothetical protein
VEGGGGVGEEDSLTGQETWEATCVRAPAERCSRGSRCGDRGRDDLGL